eukprot:jgi/Mesvir1/2768/Mv11554-RA.1
MATSVRRDSSDGKESDSLAAKADAPAPARLSSDVPPATKDATPASTATATTPAKPPSPFSGLHTNLLDDIKSAIADLKQRGAAKDYDFFLKPILLWLLAAAAIFILVSRGWSLAWAILAIPSLACVEGLLVERAVRQQVRAPRAALFDKHFPEVETVNWINTIMALVWSNFSLFIAEEVVRNVTPVLKESKPSVISDIGFARFDLGTAPPELASFKVDRSDPGKLVMELDVYWKADFKVDLFAKMMGAKVKVGVRDLYVWARSIRVEVVLKPNEYPFARTAAIQMKVDPEIDVVVKTIGLSVSEIPVLEQWLKGLVVSIIKSIFCPPQKFELNIEEIMGNDPSKAAAKLEEANKQRKSLVTTGVSGTGKVGKAVGSAGIKAVGALGDLSHKGIGEVGSVLKVGMKFSKKAAVGMRKKAARRKSGEGNAEAEDTGEEEEYYDGEEEQGDANMAPDGAMDEGEGGKGEKSVRRTSTSSVVTDASEDAGDADESKSKSKPKKRSSFLEKLHLKSPDSGA